MQVRIIACFVYKCDFFGPVNVTLLVIHWWATTTRTVLLCKSTLVKLLPIIIDRLPWFNNIELCSIMTNVDHGTCNIRHGLI